jgi:hypothetical protein
MTANQVVAYNLRVARTFRRLSQEEAAERLEPYLGTRWSRTNFSNIERSIDGKRIKQFSADEIVAFSLAFELPVAWFFVPPEQDPWGRLPNITPPTDVSEDRLVTDADLTERVIDTGGIGLESRLDNVIRGLPVEREQGMIILKLLRAARDIRKSQFYDPERAARIEERLDEGIERTKGRCGVGIDRD